MNRDFLYGKFEFGMPDEKAKIHELGSFEVLRNGGASGGKMFEAGYELHECIRNDLRIKLNGCDRDGRYEGEIRILTDLATMRSCNYFHFVSMESGHKQHYDLMLIIGKMMTETNPNERGLFHLKIDDGEIYSLVTTKNHIQLDGIPESEMSDRLKRAKDALQPLLTDDFQQFKANFENCDYEETKFLRHLMWNLELAEFESEAPYEK